MVQEETFSFWAKFVVSSYRVLMKNITLKTSFTLISKCGIKDTNEFYALIKFYYYYY